MRHATSIRAAAPPRHVDQPAHRGLVPLGPSEERRAVRRWGVGERAVDAGSGGQALLRLYDTALPAVHGYLLSRCGSRALAEDLTAEVFLAAVDAVRREHAPPVTVPWLIGTARHKLVDHWRRQGREDRGLHALVDVETHDPWDARLEEVHARGVLDGLGPHHRAALTLRYLDDLPVPQVAAVLGRTTHATEALLVRARSAFRRACTAAGQEDPRA